LTNAALHGGDGQLYIELGVSPSFASSIASLCLLQDHDSHYNLLLKPCIETEITTSVADG